MYAWFFPLVVITVLSKSALVSAQNTGTDSAAGGNYVFYWNKISSDSIYISVSVNTSVDTWAAIGFSLNKKMVTYNY
jgi:hypothetical protein